MDSSPPIRLRRRPEATLQAVPLAPLGSLGSSSLPKPAQYITQHRAPTVPHRHTIPVPAISGARTPASREAPPVPGEDTPSHLRELEAGWRARRRRVLDGRTTKRDGKGKQNGQYSQIGQDSVILDTVLRGTRRKSTPTGTMGAKTRRQTPEVLRTAPYTAGHTPIVGEDEVAARLMAPGPSSGSMTPAPQRRVSIRSLPPTPPASPPNQPPVGWDKHKIQATDSGRPRPRKPSQGIPTVSQRDTAHLSDPARSLIAPCPPAAPPPAAPSASNSPRLGAVRPYPLPPTPHPIPLARSGETIYIPPYSSSRGYEAILTLSGGRVVRILAGGRAMRFSLPHGGRRALEQRDTRDNEERRQSENESEREIRLAAAGRWSGQEAREWRAVESLITAFKRRTPRVKLFHPLGELCITCSDPPDVVLSFVHPHRSSRGEDERESNRFNNSSRVDRVERAELVAERREEGKEVKVRATFSRVMGHVKIDTSISWSALGRGGGGGGTTPETRAARGALGAAETFRTRRVIMLSQVNATTATVVDGVSPGVDPRSTKLRAGNPRSRSSSGGSDGLRHLDMRGWSEGEREAVRRLLLLEREWGRYA